MATVRDPASADMLSRSGPDMSLKERQRLEREQLILQAATELLVEKGYHETSMEEIAARVGISKGAVYLHFTSKEELIAALFEHGARAFASMMSATLAADDTPREKLSVLIEQVHGAMSKRLQFVTVVLQNPELLRLLASRRETMAALWTEPSQRIAAVIDEGKACGQIDNVLPTQFVVALLWNLLSPHGYEQLISRDHMAVEDLVAHLRRYFLRGIAALELPEVGGEER